MVPSILCFSKYLSDEPMVSRGVPSPGFLTWYWLWRGDILGKMTKNCRKITNSTFFGKTIRGTGKDKPIFGVVQGFPQFSTLWEILRSPPQWARPPKETHCNGQNSGWKFRPYFRPLLGTPIYCPELWNKYFHEKWL